MGPAFQETDVRRLVPLGLRSKCKPQASNGKSGIELQKLDLGGSRLVHLAELCISRRQIYVRVEKLLVSCRLFASGNGSLIFTEERISLALLTQEKSDVAPGRIERDTLIEFRESLLLPA